MNKTPIEQTFDMIQKLKKLWNISHDYGVKITIIDCGQEQYDAVNETEQTVERSDGSGEFKLKYVGANVVIMPKRKE